MHNMYVSYVSRANNKCRGAEVQRMEVWGFDAEEGGRSNRLNVLYTKDTYKWANNLNAKQWICIRFHMMVSFVLCFRKIRSAFSYIYFQKIRKSTEKKKKQNKKHENCSFCMVCEPRSHWTCFTLYVDANDHTHIHTHTLTFKFTYTNWSNPVHDTH